MRRHSLASGLALRLSLLVLLSLAACSPKTEESPSLLWCWAVQPPLGTQTVLLEGLALDGQGHPLPAVTVLLKPCGAPGSPLQTASDAAGRFRLEVPLAETRGCLEATASGSTLTLRDLPLSRPASIHALAIFKPSKSAPVALLVDDRAQPAS